jgi:glycosyltransferase involved in cell wall biosynthesis
MVEDLPGVSVLIPCYNHAAYLTQCVESIWAQPERGIEIILIDDGSTDGSAAIARELGERSPVPMRVVVQENVGLNRTLNRALRLARGEFVALIASDDWFAPDRFTAQLERFRQNPALRIAYGNGWAWEEGERSWRVHEPEVRELLGRPPAEILHYLYTNVSPLYIQSCLFRRDFLLEIGGFDEAVLADDWVLNILIFRALRSAAEFAYVDADVFHYRRHPANSSADLSSQAQRVLQVIDTYTPAEYRKPFKRRMYRHYAWIALARRQFLQGIRYSVTALGLDRWMPQKRVA